MHIIRGLGFALVVLNICCHCVQGPTYRGVAAELISSVGAAGQSPTIVLGLYRYEPKIGVHGEVSTIPTEWRLQAIEWSATGFVPKSPKIDIRTIDDQALSKWDQTSASAFWWYLSSTADGLTLVGRANGDLQILAADGNGTFRTRASSWNHPDSRISGLLIVRTGADGAELQTEYEMPSDMGYHPANGGDFTIFVDSAGQQVVGVPAAHKSQNQGTHIFSIASDGTTTSLGYISELVQQVFAWKDYFGYRSKEGDVVLLDKTGKEQSRRRLPQTNLVKFEYHAPFMLHRVQPTSEELLLFWTERHEVLPADEGLCGEGDAGEEALDLCGVSVNAMLEDNRDKTCHRFEIKNF